MCELNAMKCHQIINLRHHYFTPRIIQILGQMDYVIGILRLLFQNGVSNFQFIIFCCYLPPEESPAVALMIASLPIYLNRYIHNYVDIYFICCDLNGRIGNNDDFARDVDHPQRDE